HDEVLRHRSHSQGRPAWAHRGSQSRPPRGLPQRRHRTGRVPHLVRRPEAEELPRRGLPLRVGSAPGPALPGALPGATMTAIVLTFHADGTVDVDGAAGRRRRATLRAALATLVIDAARV